MTHPEQKKETLSRILRLSLGALAGGFMLSGALYAAGMFSSISFPTGQAPGGSYSGRLVNISKSCPSKSFVKGFDANYNPICVPYNAPNSASSSASLTSFSTPLTNGLRGGRFGTYFNNLLNVCSANGIVKGFNSQGGKICVNSLDRSTPTDSPSPASFVAMSTPSTPSWEAPGGRFQSYFTNMFTSCGGANQWVAGIGIDGTPICATIPLDGACGGSNGGNFYSSSEISSPCSSGTSSGIGWGGPWSWTCNGTDGGSSASCSANKKVDGGWSGFGACSASCWPGTQSRSCTNPSPQNGGLSCAGSSSQSCNNGACCVPNGSCSATPACETTGYGVDNCGNSCSRYGGACACIPNGSCSAPEPACETTTYGTDNCGNSCSKPGGSCNVAAACISNGSCSAPAPACGTTSYGTDNCGTSCSRNGAACVVVVAPPASCGSSGWVGECNMGSVVWLNGYFIGRSNGSRLDSCGPGDTWWYYLRYDWSCVSGASSVSCVAGNMGLCEF